MSTNDSSAIGSLLTGASAVVQAYDEMEMDIDRYLLLVIAPSAAFFVFMLFATITAPLPLVVRIPIPLLGLLVVGTAVIYPKLSQDRRSSEMGDRMHLFVTHMTILASTNIDRIEVFRTLANEEEYGALAGEMRRIVELVETWNQSLDDACRMRSRQVPNEAVANFLERLAYVLNAGQEIGDFLVAEQDMIIRNYKTHYQSSLDNLEVLKDLYLSMILSMTFALVFATVLPILTGNNPMLMVAAVLVLFFIIQAVFLYSVKVLTPNDPLWYQVDGDRTRFDYIAIGSLGAAGVGVVGIIGFLATAAAGLPPGGLIAPGVHQQIPLPFLAAIPTTPLLIPGYVYRQEEKRIRKRDEEFSSFVRDLGASESVKQSTTSDVLATLRTRNFGPLTENVDNLYRRLNIRIDTERAWDHFSAEARSNLIQKFSEMYVIGREMGGDPKMLGELISENMNEVIQLREQRAQSAVTFIGILYGITAAATFAFFIGLEVVAILADLSSELQAPELDIGQLIHPDTYNIPLIEALLVVIIVYNAMLSALMIRMADGGHKLNSFVHFVLLTWLGAIVAWFTQVLITELLAIG